MSDPRLTVLIPTRERAHTLRYAIETCLADDVDVTVIVSDNVSTDDTADVVHGFTDPRLRYVKPDRRLSMTGNFEFSLSHAPPGSYVMHLGDDDGIIAGGLDYVRATIADTGTEALVSAHGVYHWPDSLDEARRNKMVLPAGKGVVELSSMDVASHVANYRDNYTVLPSTYVAFVSTGVIDRVKAGGRYYRSITPDSYGGFVNAAQLRVHHYSRRPFMLSGLSGRSNGGSQVHPQAGPGEAARYVAENDLPFHPDLVYTPASVPIVVAEAFLQARDHEQGLSKVPFSIERLCHVALRDADPANYEAVRAAVMEIMRRNGLDGSPPDHQTARMRAEHFGAKTAVRLRRLREGYRRIDCAPLGVRTIADAMRLAGDVLKTT